MLYFCDQVQYHGGGGGGGNEPHNDLLRQLHVFICDYLLYNLLIKYWHTLQSFPW